MTNNNEAKVRERYARDGYKCLRGGAPDFVFFKVSGNQIDKASIVFVEVKTHTDRMRYEQSIWREIAGLLGLPYRVELV